MTSSLSLLAVYAALLVAIVLTPYVSLHLASRHRWEQLSAWPLCLALFGGALILTSARHGEVLLLSAFLLFPLLRSGACALLGGLTAVLFFTTVIWWTSTPELALVAGIVFILLALVVGFLPHWKTFGGPVDRDPRLLMPMLLCLVIGVLIGMLTAPFESLEPLKTAWHHWGALLAPVEAWRGGGVPYRDFPIQYGLGPTTLLLASCGDDCWRGMFYTAILANSLYFATLTGSVFILTARLPRGVRWLALAAMFCATFIWTGFPIQFASAIITPAVAGLRFLTISALLFYILLAEQRQIRRDWIGHMIWLADLFWSPEAGFFATVIWWPYLAMRDAAVAKDGHGAWIALLRGALRGVVAVAIGLCALALTLWLLSDRAVTAESFLAYIQHPPGMRPINPTGTIWIALASVALAIVALARQGFSSAARSSYTCLLGFVAAGIYYLSRSHDNNILNLFPLLILPLLAVLASIRENAGKASDFTRSFIHIVLAAMVAFVATFNFEPWQEGAAHAGLFHLGPARMVARLTPSRDDKPALLPPDAAAGLEYLRGRHAGVVLLFDERKLMPRPSTGLTWTSVNNIANYEPLPRPTIEHYVRRGAASYHRSGWILADALHRPWVDAFKTAYDVREQRSFGDYTAYYMVSR